MQLEKKNAKSGVQKKVAIFNFEVTHNLNFGMNKIETVSQRKV